MNVIIDINLMDVDLQCANLRIVLNLPLLLRLIDF